MALPIHEYRDQFIEAVHDNSVLVVVGDTGSGKTTQVPQFIHAAFPDFHISITQPRRIAAITVARRVAKEMNSQIGQQVGYAVRFDARISYETKIRYCTDGVLLREACDDQNLSHWDVVIVDEAHERTVDTDVVLGLLKRARKIRPQLRIIVMSATLDVRLRSIY